VKRRSFLTLILLASIIIGVLFWLASPEIQIMARPNRIGVIEVKGVIDDVQETLKDVVKFRKDSNVKAIVLRIESPGGAVGPSQELYRELRRTRDTKPVIASLGAVAASGGYYIASATSRIFASPGTVTGSIGVIVYYPNLQGLFEKIGYSMTAIKSGQFKDLGNPDREMTAEEKALLQTTLDEVHRQFIQDVARGRDLPQEKIRAIADGRILTGESAKTLGLVDELGNFEDALESAAMMGKIEGEPKLIYAKKEKFSLVDFLLGSELSSQIRSYSTSFSCVRYQAPFVP
jgi:protease-4